MKRLLVIGAAAIAVCGVCRTASAEDGYIESEGDAYVSLGHCAGPNTKIEVDFQLTEVEYDTKPFGSWGNHTATYPMFSLYISYVGDVTDQRFSWDCTDVDGTRQALNFDKADLKRHIISFDAPNSTYASTNVTDGGAAYTHKFSKAVSNSTSPYPLAVFARGADKPATQSGHFGGATKMKVYGVKIYESGNLVKTYTPCLKGGIPGLKVTGPGVDTFVTGIDVSKVKYGGDILVEKDDPYISTEINDVYATYSNGDRVYIDTEYYFKTYSRVELDFAPLTPTDWTTSHKYREPADFMYARKYDPTRELEVVGRNGTGNIGIYIGNADPIDVVPLSTAKYIRRSISISSNFCAMVTAGYTNYTKLVTSAGYGLLNDLTTTLKLGTSSGSGNFAPMKIYGLKIFEFGTLVKHYKPIVTNGVPGLIDVMNPSDICYSSTYGGSKYARMLEAGGDFTFTDGSDEAYLEFDGSSARIDTGVVVTKDSVIEADFALWNAKTSPQQVLLVQDGGDGILAWLYLNSEFKYSYQFRDFTGSANAINSGVLASNDRRQFKLDGPNAQMTIKCGDDVLYNQSITDGERTRTGGSTTLKIGNAAATMRLYGFKVTTEGSLVRDFVPCVTNGVAGLYDLCEAKFYPLPGGKVRGKGAKSVNGEFIVRPQQSMKIAQGGTGTLTCLAVGAQSYEWYEDGVLMEGETSDSLTLDWERTKAKMNNHTHTYSVKPVYTVFNETVVGEAAETTVEYTPLGTIIKIR